MADPRHVISDYGYDIHRPTIIGRRILPLPLDGRLSNVVIVTLATRVINVVKVATGNVVMLDPSYKWRREWKGGRWNGGGMEG